MKIGFSLCPSGAAAQAWLFDGSSQRHGPHREPMAEQSEPRSRKGRKGSAEPGRRGASACASEHPRGAHAPSRVVFGVLAEDGRFRPFYAVCDEGVENHPRGRGFSPKFLRARGIRINLRLCDTGYSRASWKTGASSFSVDSENPFAQLRNLDFYVAPHDSRISAIRVKKPLNPHEPTPRL